ncbi:MAG: carbohydrate porin [Thermodesulfobacteriota bacterium]
MNPTWQYLQKSITLHGSVVAHYQHYANATVMDDGEKEDSTACISPQLEMKWEPVEQGSLHARLRYTRNRVDLSQKGIVLANLLDTNVSAKDNGRIRLQRLYYTQNFLNDRAFVAFGKTDGETYLDTNAFANDSRSQFTGQPLVDNPVLDDEDEYAPFLALGGRPVKGLHLLILTQSSSWPMGDHQKEIWEDMADHPLVAVQATFSPRLDGHQGNYRLYGWLQSYDHPSLVAAGYEKGWGIGLSLDQWVTEDVGLFARLGHQNDHVYEVPWFWSAGVSVKDLIPGREGDTFGLGMSGLKANPNTPNEGTEIHLEAYYRIRLSRHFLISPDLQYVLNPLGNNDETGIFASMLRAEFCF